MNPIVEIADLIDRHEDDAAAAAEVGGYVPTDDEYEIEVPLGLLRRLVEEFQAATERSAIGASARHVIDRSGEHRKRGETTFDGHAARVALWCLDELRARPMTDAGRCGTCGHVLRERAEPEPPA